MMKKQNKIYLGIGIVAVVLIAFIIILSNQEKDEEVIKIGVITPLTGFTAESGQNVKLGLDLGRDFIYERDGINFQLVYEDGKCLGAEAISAFKKLNLDKDIQIITGFICSSEVLPIAPLLENSNKILVPSVASSPLISDASNSIFRVAPNDKEDALLHFDYIQENYNANQTIGITYINNDYGVAIKDILERELISRGYKVELESFNFGDSDFRTIIQKYKNKDVEIISFIGYPENSVVFLRQAYELNVNKTILGSWGTLSDEFFKQENQFFLEDFLVTSFGDMSSEFETLFKEKYNREPVAYSDFGFDSMLVLAEIYREGEENIEEKIKLINIENGATGDISFDEKGDRVGLKTRLYSITEQNLICKFGC
jgi:branched-chain amino acid transport system substrate-binding protein